MKDALDTKTHPKAESYALVKQLKDELAKELPEGDADAKKKLSKYFGSFAGEDLPRAGDQGAHTALIAAASIRSGEISIEVGVLPRVHGSALFTRGETQALVTVTLGTTDDSQRLETYQGEQRKRFMLHYNFPALLGGRSGPYDRHRAQ